MGKFRALLLVSLRAMLTSLRLGGGKRRKKAATGVGALIFIAALALYLSGLYSFLFAGQLAQMGQLSLLLVLLPVLAVVMGFLFTLFAAQGILFGGRDNDLMLSLPVSAFTLLLARTAALYLENLVFCVFVLLPAGVAYLVFGGGGGVLFFGGLLISAPFLALLPTLLAMVCGFVLSWLSGKFRRTALVSTVLYFLLFAGVMVLALRMNTLIAGLLENAAGLRDSFAGWGLPFLLLERGLCGGSLPALLGFFGICLIPFLAVVWIFSRRYKAILSRLAARGARSDYKLGRLAASGQRRALLQKEARRFFGTPIYLFNSGIGLIFLLAMAVACLIFRGKVLELLDLMAQMGLDLPLAPLLACAVCMLLSTVAVTASSISLEGKQPWILREAPLSARTLLGVKAGFHLLLCLPCALAACLCGGLALGLSAGELLLVCALCALFAGFCALFGLYLNLCLPRLDAPNDMVVVKQSASAMVCLFTDMLLVIAEAGLYVLLQGPLGWTGALLVCALPHTAGFLVCLLLLRRRGPGLLAGL